ncbi:MAG TPA: hypothetical protein PLU53_09380 [Bacteroidia bacterium]|nr:hypothetical protein [Bacteroidia bacterium]
MSGLFGENATMFYPDHDKEESWRISPSKKGEYEQYIFCKSCEQLLGKYEDYAAKFFGNELKDEITKSIETDPDGVEYIHYGGLKYAPLKLFVYSLFWRASISTRDTFKLKLDSRVEENLRQRLLNGEPGSYHDFPVNFLLFLRPKISKSFHISSPHFAMKGLYQFYHTGVFASGLILELITEVQSHIDILSTALREDGTINVFTLNEEDSFILYRRILREPGITDEVLDSFLEKFRNDNKLKDPDHLKKTASTFNNPPLGYLKNRKKAD